MNTAADFLSRAEVNTTEKLEMNIQNDVTTKAIEINTQSTGVTEKEPFYILPQDIPTEQQLWEEKETLRRTAKEETHNEPENEVSELQNFHRPTAGTFDYRKGYFKGNEKYPLNKTTIQFYATFEQKFKVNRMTKLPLHKTIDINTTYKTYLVSKSDKTSLPEDTTMTRV